MVRVPVTAAIVLVLLASGLGHAAVFPCPSGDVTCLIMAINTAKGDGPGSAEGRAHPQLVQPLEG
jgi:hypothetical protein